ncbi:adenosylcobinamide amidohydrolase [Lentzea sp. HUAS12]|nr:adenosylcobinamide amidohydrolase [Lentzea sp. HUAS12]
MSTAVVGGGIGSCNWVVNAEVDHDYHRDPVEHLLEITAQLRLSGRGAGMVTAAEVKRYASATADRGVHCATTVGLSYPVFASAPHDEVPRSVGTINTFCWVPVPLEDGALVNMVVTATEAKSQALTELDIPGTGTASDAVVICCPEGPGEQFGGPRSVWGAELARAVHTATLMGARDWLSRNELKGLWFQG